MGIMQTYLSRCCAAISILLLFGCAQKKMVTITTQPPDASIRVDGAERGRSPLTQLIIFKDAKDSHMVTASKMGFKERTILLPRDTTKGNVNIDLKPLTRVINLLVQPVPAVVRINGKPVA